ncbi:protein trichome berefringence-like 7 [Phoenix dactylifera]|uniref:Protein trichome berefringence-like 7 n=1 Tax=Phoenix dactylifera TaxID=42345 RepID=A0A8B7CGZ0_PHODC|nr:protein trichome berefringence-like 7 [Phoenix dactylifera]
MVLWTGRFFDFLEMATHSLTRSASARITPRSLSSPRVSFHRKWWAPGLSLNALAVTFLLASLVLVLGCVIYLYVFRFLGRGFLVSGFVGPTEGCDVFDGSWVQDDTYPLYNSSECPFAERGFNCLANGRKDTDYLKWRWKPRHCEMPKINVREVLESLRGKRVVFVGDSMSRTQWESLICMLMTGVEDPKTVYEVNGNQISKTIRFLGVRFETFNLSVEFFRSVFLVQQGSPPKHGPKRVRMTLKLDKMDDVNWKWVDSDVLIFNSGHWWTPSKLFDMGCYFQAGGLLKLGMSINSAFKMALETWALWVETMVNTNRTHVFFRTYEPSHWSGSNQKACEVTQQPLTEAKGNDRSEFAEIIAEVVTKMRVPVTVLNVTSMGAFRSDAHIGTWSHPSTILDCSHWCLPGVPDAWNELVFSYLLTNGWRKLGR